MYTEAVGRAGVRDQLVTAIVLEHPTHAIANQVRFRVHSLGGPLEANGDLRRVGFGKVLRGNEALAVPLSVAELETHPGGEVAGAGMERTGRVGVLHLVEGNSFYFALGVLAVRQSVVGF